MHMLNTSMMSYPGLSPPLFGIKSENVDQRRAILETFRAYAPTPYVVAANKQDINDAWDMKDIRIALRLDPKVKLLPCVATNKESVKSALLELLYSILAEMES